MEVPQNKEIYEFGEFRLSVRERLLWRGDRPVQLTLKEFEVLLFLVENAGEVIDKNRLLDAVWKDVFIEEGTLTRNISRLRKKLETGNGETEKIIETLPKRGYRFLPEVTLSNGDAIVIEERTTSHLLIEETLTIDLETEESENKIVALPPAEPPVRAPNAFSASLLIVAALIALGGIGFIIYQNYYQNQSARVVLASRVAPFSGATGRENTPAFSPDGRSLAYSWNEGKIGRSDIYIRLVGAGDPLRLTDTEVNEHYPTFSPDGSLIAFVRQHKNYGEVIAVPSLGGAERRIARLFSGTYSISYSPDGQTIAVIDTENSVEAGQFAIHLVDVETGERRRLTAPADFSGETTPRFSPDGERLAFVRIDGDGKQDLFVAAATGGEPRQITFDGAVIHSLAWSADGRTIYFVSLRGGNQPNIWRVPASGGAEEIVPVGGKGITNVATSPDGKTLAFVETAFNTAIWRVTANGNQPGEKLIVSTANERFPQFSPDGTRIMFLSDRTGKYEIWTTDAAGSNARKITNMPIEVGSPQYSPDGARIAFDAHDGEDSDVYVISAEGGAARRVTSGPAWDSLPAWSADGRWIYFASNRTGETNLWKIPSDGGEAVQITRHGAYRAAPAPDGTIFYTKSDSDAEFWRAPASGGAEAVAAELLDAGFSGGWAFRREGIYFIARESDQSGKIKFYDFSAGRVTDLGGDYRLPQNFQGNFGVNPSGDVFLFSLEDQNASRIMLAEIAE